MENLLFVAVIIFFSIVESIARKKKARRVEGPGGVTPSGRLGALEQDFSWENEQPDLPTYDGVPSYVDGLSFEDALAEGTSRSRDGHAPEHRIHRAHAGYGTDPSERAPSEQDGLDPLKWVLSEDARAIRAQLMSRGDAALRQAIILQEVLGPPVSTRDDD